MSLFDRNVAAVVRLFPEFADAFAQLPEPASRVVGSITADDINLDLGHTTLYPYSAARFASEQIDQFLNTPSRFFMEPPLRAVERQQQQFHLTEALYAHFGDREIPSTPSVPKLDAGGYLLVYGIGLGLHLPRLLAETPVRHIILIEEHVEFFFQSLHIVDWAAIIDRLAANGQTIFFIFGGDPKVVGGRVHWYMRGAGFGLLDGSYLFRHYSSTLLDTAYKDFVENLPLLPISIGYFEDELVMLANCTANLVRYDFSLLDVRPRLQKDVPAFIVGSGPSLDSTIEHIKRLRGHAIVFSSGTALRPLMRAGIRPDFHCELENGFESVEQIQQIAAEYHLDGIALLASTTVHPTLPAMFGARTFYFRDSVSSTPLWSPDPMGILGTAPTCTNLALRAAMILGFREVYLFGVDLGTRDPKDHHAVDTIYHHSESWRDKIQESDPIRAMTIELPGNFGGKAYSNQILHWARMMMVQTIEVFSAAKIYNCSNGVTVPGTLPKLAQTIRIATPPARRAVTLDRLTRELEAKRPGEMAPIDTVTAVRRAFHGYYAGLRAAIAQALKDELRFTDFYSRLRPFLAVQGDEPFHTVLRSVNIGTVMMCLQVGYYFCRRVPPDEELPVMRTFLAALDERIVDMSTILDRLLAGLEVRPALAA